MTADQPFDWRAHLKVHPAADLLPLLPPDELRTLADDMAANPSPTRTATYSTAAIGLML
jgi:hypothetical protein